MKTVDVSILHSLAVPAANSHKGQNGRLLIIAGSAQFHGALLLTVMAASRIVDMVYVCTTDENRALIKKLKSKTATFVGVQKADLWKTVERVDAVVIGPGLEESEATIRMVEKLLRTYRDKKTVVDATALWHVQPSWLHPNCVATPHSREFRHVFGYAAKGEHVKKAAKEGNCIVVLKGKEDYISNGADVWVNKTGNVGLTKGGTGDVMAGLIGALATTNELLTATLTGVYLNGLAGDRLHERAGRFYNAEDVIEELGKVWKEHIG